MNLDDAAKQARREYFKKWRAANKDKVRKHNQNYWRKKALDRMKESKSEETEEIAK